MPKQSNMSQKVYKNVIKFAVCCLFTAEYGACPSMWLLYLIASLGENQIFLSKHVLIRDSFWVRNGSLCSLPPLSTGILSCLDLCRPCAWRHSPCEFIYASVLLCVEDTISFDSYNIG